MVTKAPRYIADDETLSHLLLQWHPTKNGELTPENITRGSGKSIWWLCDKYDSHEWTASPLARSSMGQGCPFCSGRRVLSGFNDLATVNPILTLEWHPTLNTEFSPGTIAPSSNKSVYWLCPVGEDHIWKATVNSRKAGNGCPYCGNRKVLAGFNDLASNSQYENVVKQWHPAKNKELTPDQVSVSSSLKVWWLGECGHEWPAPVANRTLKGSGCSECYKKTPKKKLSTVFESPLYKEWSPNNAKNAKDVTLGSDYLAEWICPINSKHIWEATIVHRMRGVQCTVCSNRKIVKGINDLQSMSQYVDIVSQWHPDNKISPDEVGAGTELSVKWQCENGHTWFALIYSRTKQGHGCPECIGRTEQGIEKLKISHYPELLEQWHPDNILKVEEISFRSKKIVTWICGKDKRHIWNASPSSRSLDGSDCPVCAGRLILEGINDIASNVKFKDIVAEWHPNNSVLPTQVSFSSDVVIEWQCLGEEEHTWKTPIYTRTRTENPTGCPRCALVKTSSKGEDEIYAVLMALGLDDTKRHVTNSIYNRELDLLVPSQKFAIEFNGLYWHSDAIRKDAMYHAKKRQACLDKGLTLYSVWEDDWKFRKAIVVRSIAHKLGKTELLPSLLPEVPSYWFERIGARKTKSVIITYEEASEFLENHHIQGRSSGAYYVALVDNEARIRAVMVLSRIAKKESSFRIDRYATAGNVVGGFTKLLKFAEVTTLATEWVTFADLAVSDGGLYESNGFIVDKHLAPDYTYFVKGCRVHKFNYRISRFKKDPSLQYEDDLSERELARLNNLSRIWDFGKIRYVKTITQKEA